MEEMLPDRDLKSIRRLTCGLWLFCRDQFALFGTKASALQQSLEGAMVLWRWHTAKPLGTAKGVHPAGFPQCQDTRAGVVPGGPTRTRVMPVFAGQAVFMGP